MAQPFCQGAVHYIIRLPGGSPTYLGTTEGLPTTEMQRAYAAVMNDLAGSRLPYDYLYMGEEGLISYALTRFNHTVVTAIDAIFGGAQQSLADLGSLMVTEGFTAELWLRYQFGGRASMPGMPAGKHFPNCILLGPDVIEGGNNPEKVHHIWKACRKFNPQTGVFSCWDEDMSLVTSVAIN